MKKTNHQLLEKKLKNTFFAAKVSFKLFLCLCACPAVASAADAPGQLAAHYIDDGSKEDKSTLVNTGVQERRYELGVGDRLSLKVYQRDDLSGVLRVQDDGSISVPLLGKIRAVGRVPKQLEKEIASTLREMNGQWTSVAVEVLEWRPIYVVGGVNKPGVYSYSPGLTVLHAIALAGGFERFPATSNIELNASQNIITSRTAENRLMSLLIRRERLRSEISEKASIEQLPREMASFGRLPSTQRKLEIENELLRLKAKKNDLKMGLLKKQLELSRMELLANESRKEKIEHSIRLGQAELSELDKLNSRGLLQRSRWYQLRREVSTGERELSAANVDIVQAKKSIQEAQHSTAAEREKIKIEARQELGQINEEIDQQKIIVAETRNYMRLAKINRASRLGIDQLHISYELMRRVNGRSEFIQAKETAEVFPGDLLRISFAMAVVDASFPAARRNALAAEAGRHSHATFK